MYQTESAKPPFIGDLGWRKVGGRMFEAIEIPVHGGPGGAGLVAFVIALAVCVLVGGSSGGASTNPFLRLKGSLPERSVFSSSAGLS